MDRLINKTKYAPKIMKEGEFDNKFYRYDLFDIKIADIAIHSVDVDDTHFFLLATPFSS